jgi:DNA-binding NarL/FixJ family response regulator
MKRITVLLADDHATLIDGLVHTLGRDFQVVGGACDGRTLIEMAKEKRPDVIVTDISMPNLNGIDAARILRRDMPSVKILFLTMHSDFHLVEEAFRVGASGFVLKTCDMSELVKAIHSIAKGSTYITPQLAEELISLLITTDPKKPSRATPLTSRQREVLQLLSEGKTMKEAAAVMGISTRTAETHKYETMRQLGLKTTAALIRYAIRIKLVAA